MSFTIDHIKSILGKRILFTIGNSDEVFDDIPRSLSPNNKAVHFIHQRSNDYWVLLDKINIIDVIEE